MSNFYKISTAIAELGSYAIKMLNDNKFVGRILVYMTNIINDST